MALGVLLAAAALSAGGDARAEGWRDGAPIPAARSFAAAAARGETLYVGGGAGLTGPVSDFSAYDVLGDIWRPLPSMPVGRQNFAMAEGGDGGIYVSGGYVAEGADGAGRGRDFWRYDIVTAVWVRLPDMPVARARHGMAAVDGRVYVIGGEGGNVSRVLVYDISRGAWSDLGADLPVARKDLAVVRTGRRIHAIGGRLLGSGAATGRVDVLEIAPGAAARWAQGPALPFARAEAAAGVVAGTIHLAGGRANDPMKTYADHVMLEAGAGGWRAGPALPLPRVGAAAGGVAGRFVVAGGSGGTGVFSFFTATDAVSVFEAR